MPVQFTFASMIHRGFFADQSATTEVKVAVPGKEAIVRRVPMMTPGDVIGIPARQVIRCAPLNGVVDAEPNYLATIDFDAPDLPWLFSRKPASGPIQPWITLAVIDVTDLKTDPLSASPVGTQLTIAAAQLPNPAEAWMWAHGQLLDTDTVPGDPARSLSRLVSSRKLEQNRRYLACVVPIFAAGKTAGLGIDPGDARTSMDFAWNPAGSEVTLPVYYFWRFATGPNGDFESLVRQLHGVSLPPGLGMRKLLLDYPMSGLPVPNPDGASLGLQVALRAPGASLDEIQPLVGASYLDVLRSRLVDAGYDTSLLTAHADAPPPAVGPPVYGQLAVGGTATAADLQTVAPPWVRDDQSRSAAARRRGPGRRGRPAEPGPLRRRSLAAGRRRARRERPPPPRRVLAGRQRDSPPEMDLADLGSRPRHINGARSLARFCRYEPHDHRTASAVAAPAIDRLGRIPAGHAGARQPAGCGGVACVGRSRGSGVAVGWRASVESRCAARHDRRARRTKQGMGSSSGAVDSGAARPRSRPDGHDRGAGRDPARFDEPAPDGRLRPRRTRPRRTWIDRRRRRAHRSGHAAVGTCARVIATTPRDSHGARRRWPSRDVSGRRDDDDPPPGRRTLPARPEPAQTVTVLKQQMTDVAKVIIGRQIVAIGRGAVAGHQPGRRLRRRSATIVAALDPAVTMVRMINHRISALTDAQATGLDDIMAAPDLSEPTYQALAAISHDWLLPGHRHTSRRHDDAGRSRTARSSARFWSA